jgi:hypothetical protein
MWKSTGIVTMMRGRMKRSKMRKMMMMMRMRMMAKNLG